MVPETEGLVKEKSDFESMGFEVSAGPGIPAPAPDAAVAAAAEAIKAGEDAAAAEVVAAAAKAGEGDAGKGEAAKTNGEAAAADAAAAAEGGEKKDGEGEKKPEIDLDNLKGGFGDTAAPAVDPAKLTPEEMPVKMQEMQGKYDELAKEHAKLKDASPFFSDKVKAYDEAMRKGVSEDTFFRVQSSKPDDMSPTDKIVHMKMWKNGLSEEDAKKIVKHEYGLGKTLGEDALEEEKAAFEETKELNEIRIKSDSQEADRYLRDKIKTSLDSSAAPQLDAEKVSTDWAPNIKEAVQKVSTYKLGDWTYKIENTEGIEKDLDGAFMNVLKLMGSNEASPENLNLKETVQTLAENIVLPKRSQDALKSLYVHMAKANLNSKVNPSGGAAEGGETQKTQPSQEQVDSGEVSIKEAIAAGN